MAEIKKIHLVYFSPSGSTEKIVKKIASAIPGLPVETHDFLRASSRKFSISICEVILSIEVRLS